MNTSDTNACAPCNLYIVRYTYGYIYEGTTNSDKYYSDEHTAIQAYNEEKAKVKLHANSSYRNEIEEVSLLHNNKYIKHKSF